MSTAKHEKVAAADDVPFDEVVSTEVNAPPKHRSLREHTGASLIALGCEPCGKFHGYAHEVKDASSVTCSGTAEEPHEETKVTRFDGDTCRVDDTGSMIAGIRIPPEDDPAELRKQMEALQERIDAAEAKKE